MKRSKTLVVCAMLGGSIMFSSCIGSFGLWNNLKDWNQGVSNKFVNELILLLSTLSLFTKSLIWQMLWYLTLLSFGVVPTPQLLSVK